MSRRVLPDLFLCGALLLPGCATYDRRGLDPARAKKIEDTVEHRNYALSRETEEKILALDPEHVTGKDISEVLSNAPAPRIINIHGGVFPIHTRMISFSRFLIGMGYPASSITNPGDGTYTFSCYESSDKIAGVIAWYYEKEGMRPMIVGHSQGGFQAVKVLHLLAGHSSKNVSVWNPLTWKSEERYEITDPLTGKTRPVVGLQLGYVTVVSSGGLTRILPNQWDINTRLRSIPDSVEEFTGFYKHFDLLGGDFLGYGSANYYEPNGKAVVRTVQLPAHYGHFTIPDTEHLLKSQEIQAWINNYRPPDIPVNAPRLDVPFDSDTSNLLWAADVWYSIKKHWVLEWQQLIRARRASRPDH